MKTLFLINPVAGKKQKRHEIQQALPLFQEKGSLYFSKKAGDITHQIQKHLSDFDMFVAVGGDGTIHEATQSLMSSNKTLGIIPCGSGNGLAFSLGISPDVKRALNVISQGEPKFIDCLKVNHFYSTNISGVGFDARICYDFAKSKKRGLLSYILLSAKQYFTYSPVTYRLSVDGKVFTRKAFFIDVANISQYGNNVHISPQSKPNDGKFEVIVLKPFSWLQAPVLLWKLWRNKVHTSKYYECFVGKDASIERVDGKELQIHVDGESHTISEPLHITICLNALKVQTL